MRTLVPPDRDILDRIGADLVSGYLRQKPDSLVVPALGNSALGIYTELGRRVAAGRLDTSRIVLAQLDEYGGIAGDDPRSLYGWLLRDVAAPLHVPPERILRLAGDTGDSDEAAGEHAQAIAEHGGIDLAILGLGPNGHLGFNEPPSAADAETRVVRLTSESLASSAAYWGALPVPGWALTIGMRELLAARQILLVVEGERKRDVLRRVLVEPPSPDLPASLLRYQPEVTLLADQAAWPCEIPWPPVAA
jgi:glucosamine-6-phosphate deaminase